MIGFGEDHTDFSSCVVSDNFVKFIAIQFILFNSLYLRVFFVVVRSIELTVRPEDFDSVKFFNG